MPETAPGSAGPTPSDDLFASPPVSEDELPEPDEVAPWDFVADDDQPELFENSVAEVATVDFEPMPAAEPAAEVEPSEEAASSMEAAESTPEADLFEAWLAMAVAGGLADTQAEPEMAAEPEPEAEADADVEPEMTAEPEADPVAVAEPETEVAESEAEAETESEFEAEAETEPVVEAEAEPESVQIEVPAPSSFPATIDASGPESGLPANVVLRIELSIVDDAKRLNVTNVASASEFAPRVEEIMSAQSPEPAPAQSAEPVAAEQVAAEQIDDSAWPAIWDPDRPGTGFAAPAAVAANPADAWAWTDPTPAETPYGLSAPTETWPEVDRPQDAFAASPEMAAGMALAPLAPLENTEQSTESAPRQPRRASRRSRNHSQTCGSCPPSPRQPPRKRQPRPPPKSRACRCSRLVSQSEWRSSLSCSCWCSSS